VNEQRRKKTDAKGNSQQTCMLVMSLAFISEAVESFTTTGNKDKEVQGQATLLPLVLHFDLSFFTLLTTSSITKSSSEISTLFFSLVKEEMSNCDKKVRESRREGERQNENHSREKMSE
jgi:hypothetical protein